MLRLLPCPCSSTFPTGHGHSHSSPALVGQGPHTDTSRTASGNYKLVGDRQI
jgi:hypothetical protein